MTMRNSIGVLICLGIFLASPAQAAASLQVWPVLKSGTFATAFQLEFLTNAADARIFWSRSADATPADGLMYGAPIPNTRSGSIYFFAFTPEPDIKATQIQKAFFFVESRTGFEHFRIREIDPKNGTASLKNYSKYPLQTAGWQIETEGKSIALDEAELAPDAVLTVNIDLNPTGQEMLLRAPDEVAKQLAVVPELNGGEVWRCETRRSTSCGVVRE